MFRSLGCLGVVLGMVGLGCGGSASNRQDGGLAVDSGLPATPHAWTWVPVDGSECALGSKTGFGVNMPEGEVEDLFIYLQGGGACWNQGTCAPSLLSYGPICDYGTSCLYNVPGGLQPTASHVSEADPYPVDGGRNFDAEVKQLQSVRVLHREDTANPFRAAAFVYVPYCTGDVHSGAATVTYQVKYQPSDMPTPLTFHFSGAKNMRLFLERLRVAAPNVKRVWLTGSSAGGYGATFNLGTAAEVFSGAQVHLLADSSPLLQPDRWAEWSSTWKLEFPAGCADCDAGMPQLFRHVVATHPSSRIALLANDHDATISWFFYGGTGPEAALNPPTGKYFDALEALRPTYDASPNARYFIKAGTGHVLLPLYGSALADGGFTEPTPSADGSSNLKAFMDAWATGGAAFQSSH